MDLNTSHGGKNFDYLIFNKKFIDIIKLGTPAELRCRYIFRFYNIKSTGSMIIEEFK